MAALFSPIFTEAKKRIKQLFNSKIIYSDGLTPDEVAAYVRNVKDGNWFYENDLSKQDRQTDEHILDVEFMLYEYLGVHLNVLSVWRTIHNTWKFKSNFSKGIGHNMRHTGQVTTSLGNLITNL